MLPPDTDAPASWPLPVIPSGGPEAAREVAATCERLAVLLRSTAVILSEAQQLCATNTGRAGAEITRAFRDLQQAHEETAGYFERSAQTMRRYADEFEAAHHRQRFSLHKILKIGAQVAVGAGLMWVTAGGATPAVAAAIGAEVAVADAAAAAATAAGEGAAAECSLLARMFAAVRGLASVSRTQIVYGEAWMTAQSVRSEAMDDRILPSKSPGALALDGAGMLAGAGAGKFAALALAGRTGTALTATVTTGASAVGGAIPQTAYDWERTGSFPARGFAWNAAKGAGSSVISGNTKKLLTKFDKWKATHHPRPQPGRHRAGRHRVSE